ncbi:MAG: 4-alpha-glucanotransferase, partial [Bacteroidaceae bacterium]|nr:4-alpha-glucanotransferase [Bacteroidaceae bacterium]
MELYFNIDYKVYDGERLQVNLDGKTLDMVTGDNYHWNYLHSMKNHKKGTYSYYYSVVKDGRVIRREWAMIPHTIEVKQNATIYKAYDRWSELPEDSYLYSSAFTECLTPHSAVKVEDTDYTKCIRIKVRAPQLRRGERLAIVGEEAVLGEWNVTQALPMKETAVNEWTVELDANKIKRQYFEFKFLAFDSDAKQSFYWEEGANRGITLPNISRGECICYELNQSFFSVANKRVAGTLVPVFSLRSKDSFGVGERLIT